MMKAFAKLSLLFTLIASIFLIIGTATKYWSLEHGLHVGLWQKGGGSWLQAVRVLVVIPIFGSVFNSILMSVYIRKEDGRTNLTRIRLAILFTLVSGVLCIAAVIVYAAKKRNELHCPDCTFGWSYILTSIAGGLLALILLPLAMEIKQSQVLGSYESI